MEWLTDPQIWIGLLTLTLLEVVLGIDNIIFISILSSKLPKNQQAKARYVGLTLAFVMRVLLLLSITWIMGLQKPLFTLFGTAFSGKSIILLLGGLFLVGKATHEIHDKLEGEEGETSKKVASRFGPVVFQIVLIDLVFSVDSVITAVGMVKYVGVMIAAVMISIAFMMVSAGKVADFVDRHPTVKMLALSFLVLIGVNLIAEGFGHHIPKGYTYFAMAFSVLVEMLNIKLRKVHTAPVKLHDRVA